MNASSVVKEPEQCQELIVKLMRKMDPPAVRQLLFKAKTLWSKTERSDLKYFADQLAEYSAQVQQVSTAITESTRTSATKSEENGGRGKQPKIESSGAENESPKSDGTGDKNGNENRKGKRKSGEEFLPDCLNPECNQKHMLKDCKMTSKEQAKNLLAEYRNRKKQKSMVQNL